MRTFDLVRNIDETGVSGTGVVAQGVEFEDGTVVMRWLGSTPSTVIHADLDSVQKIHGHDGKTVIQFTMPFQYISSAPKINKPTFRTVA